MIEVAAPLSPMATLRWSAARAVLDEVAPHQVLEIGCGQGGFGARLARRAEYVGVESDLGSFEVARRRIEPLGGRVVHGTAEQLEVSGPFDLVCAFEVVEHLDDDVSAMSAWASWVAPGGTLLISVPAWPERYGPMDELVGHYRRYTPEHLDESLMAAGYTQVRHFLYGWPLGFALEAVRNRIAAARGDRRSPTMSERTAASGRMLQPGAVAGVAVAAAVAPFAAAQRFRKASGTGLIGVGRRPPAQAGAVERQGRLR
jgi:SAM-dependent methyltransferase